MIPIQTFILCASTWMREIEQLCYTVQTTTDLPPAFVAMCTIQHGPGSVLRELLENEAALTGVLELSGGHVHDIG